MHLKQLLSSTWLTAIGILPLAYFLWGSVTSHGEDPAIGNALVIAALFFGILLGRIVVWIICRFPIPLPGELQRRLTASLSAFGFFSLPWIVAVWTNAHLGTDITLMSLEMHLFWPCTVGVFAFFATPEGESAR